jgi:hypothetical protein
MESDVSLQMDIRGLKLPVSRPIRILAIGEYSGVFARASWQE